LFFGTLQLEDDQKINSYPLKSGYALQMTDPLIPLSSPLASTVSPFSPRASDNEAKIFRSHHPNSGSIGSFKSGDVELGVLQPGKAAAPLPASAIASPTATTTSPSSSSSVAASTTAAPVKTTTAGPRVNTHPHALRRDEFGTAVLPCSLCRSSLVGVPYFPCAEQALGQPPPCDFALCTNCYEDWRSDKSTSPQPTSAPLTRKCPVSANACKSLWMLLFVTDMALFTAFCAVLWNDYTDVTDDCNVLSSPPQCRAYNSSLSIAADVTSSRLLLIGDNSICSWQGHGCRSRAYGVVIFSALVWVLTFAFFIGRSFLVLFFRATPTESHSPLLRWTWPASLGCMIVTLWALSIPSYSGVPPSGLSAITFISAFVSFVAPFIQVCFEGTCFCAPRAGRRTFSQVATPLSALILEMVLWLAFCSQLWLNWGSLSELCDAVPTHNECLVAKWDGDARGQACSWQASQCRPRIYAVGVWAAITFIVELIFAIARVGLFMKFSSKPDSDELGNQFLLYWTLLMPGGLMIWICSMWVLGVDYSGVPVTIAGINCIIVGLLVLIPIILTWASHRRWIESPREPRIRTRSSRAVSEAALAARTSRATRPMDAVGSDSSSASSAPAKTAKITVNTELATNTGGTSSGPSSPVSPSGPASIAVEIDAGTTSASVRLI
jgi:hypothetical protein